MVFRPRFYQKHRNLAKSEPWTYHVWKGPVTGYCTWWAYRGDFSQQTLDEVVDKQHPDGFVQKTNGTLFMDGGFYTPNTKNKEALDGMVRPIYRELKKQGWSYVKNPIR